MKCFHSGLCLALALLLCAFSLTACTTTLEVGDKGIYDEKNDVRYINAPAVYEAAARGEKYGVLKLNQNVSYELFLIPDVEPTEMLATEDDNIVYASTLTLPTLTEMAPTKVYVCIDGSETSHVMMTVNEQASVDALVKAAEGESLYENYPGTIPQKTYRVRFASEDYPAFYYTLTYIEYASDIEIDGVSYGRFFFMSTTEQLFVPAGDTIYQISGYADAESDTADTAETTAD